MIDFGPQKQPFSVRSIHAQHISTMNDMIATNNRFPDLTKSDRRSLLRFINDCELASGRIRSLAALPVHAADRCKFVIHLEDIESLRIEAYWQYPEIRFDEKTPLETYNIDGAVALVDRDTMGGPRDLETLRRGLRAAKRSLGNCVDGLIEWL